MKKVRVLGRAFRDRDNESVRRRPGDVFIATNSRAEHLSKGGWIEIVKDLDEGKKELKADTATKELKTSDNKTK